MCDPVSLSLGLTAAGTAAQAAGQSKARSAIANAQAAERQRQQGYQQQSNDLFNESLSHASAGNQAGGQLAHEADRKSAYANANAGSAPVNVSNQEYAGNPQANAIINSENARESAKAMGVANQAGDAKALLQGFGDQQASNDIYNKRMSQQQAQIGNFMQGSSSILPWEVEAAQRKGDTLKNIGDLMSLGGAVTGMGAGAGWWGKGVNTAANVGTTATTALKPGATLADVLASKPLTLQNFGQGGLLPFGTPMFNQLPIPGGVIR